MITHEDVFRIGRLGSAHGLKGFLDLRYTDDIFTSEDCTYLVLDIDGITGGFNFQAAWTTAPPVATAIYQSASRA